MKQTSKKNEVKILHVEVKRAKNGTVYRLVHAVVSIDGQEFVRRFALFDIEG